MRNPPPSPLQRPLRNSTIPKLRHTRACRGYLAVICTVVANTARLPRRSAAMTKQSSFANVSLRGNDGIWDYAQVSSGGGGGLAERVSRSRPPPYPAVTPGPMSLAPRHSTATPATAAQSTRPHRTSVRISWSAPNTSPSTSRARHDQRQPPGPSWTHPDSHAQFPAKPIRIQPNLDRSGQIWTPDSAISPAQRPIRVTGPEIAPPSPKPLLPTLARPLSA